MSTANPPKQRDVARARANYVRVARGAFHGELRRCDQHTGRDRVAAMLLDTPDWLENQRLFDFLKWVPRLAGTHIREALEVRLIAEHRTVGSLTWRQASDLAEALRAPGKFE